MKKIFLFCVFLGFSNVYAQEKAAFNVGDEIEYFDGVNWVDSKIAEVGFNNKYSVYIDKDQTKTRWFSAEDINLLYKNQDSMIKKETVIEQQGNPLYKAGDLVLYNDGTKIIESEIIQVNTDHKYQIFYDHTKSSTLWVNENELQLISPKKVD